MNYDIESHAVPAAGRQRRESAKTEREKEHVVAEILTRFHQFGEFFFAEISRNDFAVLREAKSDFRKMDRKSNPPESPMPTKKSDTGVSLYKLFGRPRSEG
jgi:hypothetical protein